MTPSADPREGLERFPSTRVLFGASGGVLVMLIFARFAKLAGNLVGINTCQGLDLGICSVATCFQAKPQGVDQFARLGGTSNLTVSEIEKF